MASQWAAIGVPIDSVGRAGGTELAPAALRELGLAEILGAEDRGDLPVSIRGDDRDPDSGVIGIDDVVEVTRAVREAVRETAAAGSRPFLIGGCCTLVPGALAGMRDAGLPCGVAYVDGHVDVYTGSTSPTGEAADMPMSVAFGLGPARWVEAAGGASAWPAEFVVLGARDPEEAEDIEELMAGALRATEVLHPIDLREEGPEAAAARAAERLGGDGGRFWIHLDVDVLDEAEMPATDYLMPGGLDWEETEQVMRGLGASPALAGFSLGCVNPEKDPDGRYVERTHGLLARTLA